MRRRSLTLILLTALGGCGYETLAERPCPPDGTELTYEAFAKPFFAANCNYCHSAETGEREGAPDTYVFDTRKQIQAHKERIFERSAGANNSMPPGPDDPPLEQREKLAEWLACGAP